MENDTLKLTDVDGNILEYRILSTFIYNDKNYIVYTDDVLENGKKNAYASIFDPDDDTVWEELQTDEEWEIVSQIIAKLEGEK